ncbi:hypothetical protein CYMTET_52950 [Cymbomonas tetramitiformis]|uniref:Nodulin-like domain-containing protein n=1 Tax=Cymbomonas tetramitiformis TaxID=36881 RepID=A0AAE0BJB2_9CHLO|nr:hypothetical protein CYMTET_52950 [Cymbomonas tetramitiformis]
MFTQGQASCLSLYSSTMKTELGYSQDEVDWLGVAKSASLLFACIIGATQDKLGSFYSCISSGLIGILAFTLIYFTLEGDIEISYQSMWWLHFFAYGATTAMQAPPLLTSMANFPKHRALTSSLLSSAASLGGAFFSEYDEYADDNTVVLLCGLLPGFVAFFVWPFMKIISTNNLTIADKKATGRTFVYYWCAMAFFILYMVGIEVWQIFVDFGDVGYLLSLSGYGLIIVAIIAGGMLFWASALHHEQTKESPMQLKQNPEDEGILKPQYDLYDTFSTPRGPSLPGAKTGHWQTSDFPYARVLFNVFTDWKYMLLVLASYLNMGNMSVTTDNIQQIAMSVLGIRNVDRITRYTTSLSTSLAAGRLMGGVVSEEMLKRYQTPRSFVLVMGSGISCLGVYFLAETSSDKLYFGCAMSSFGFGWVGILLSAIIFEQWGEAVYGIVNFFNIFFTNFLGSVIGSIALFAEEYNDDAQLDYEGSKYCFGNECFDTTYYVLLGLAITGTIAYMVFAYASLDEHAKLLLEPYTELPELPENRAMINVEGYSSEPSKDGTVSTNKESPTFEQYARA